MKWTEEDKVGPLAEDHPITSDGTTCAACGGTFVAGGYLMLVPVGPGGDSEERVKARTGRPYNSAAVPVHWACATGEED